MGRLIIYDTSNFIDFPIGGQLTSIRGFLRFLAEVHPERCERVVLVGVARDPAKVGELEQIELFGRSFPFLAVCAAEADLGATGHSLRLRFARGLLSHLGKLHLTRHDCNYIHTPESFGPAWLFCPRAGFVIFSHGSYGNMERGFRFFQDRKAVLFAFQRYLRMIIRRADLIFILDEDSRAYFGRYTKKLKKVTNSIVRKEGEFRPHPFAGKLLFVGRLSKDKGVDELIDAARQHPGYELTIVGDGEWREALGERAEGAGNVTFAGAVAPERVADFMERSDVLVMNSVFEGLPMTILEAQSHGLPVVTSDVGGIGSAVRFGVDAEATDRTVPGILLALERVAGDYERYSENAWENSKRFDYREVNRTVLEGLSPFWDGK